MNTIKINKQNALLIAHRGCSGLEQENTASAFVAAGNRSYFGIETDVRNTADGKYVLLHDDSTQRCGLDPVFPEQCTLQTVQAVQLVDKDGKRGRVDLRVPALEDYLRICKRYDKVGVLEFKGAYSQEQMQGIAELVKSEYSLDKMIFISFHFPNLTLLRSICPEARCQFLTGEFKQETVDLLKEHGMGLDIWYGSLDEEKVKLLLSEGIEVNCWTVDDPEAAERLISWGVQYITTNILE